MATTTTNNNGTFDETAAVRALCDGLLALEAALELVAAPFGALGRVKPANLASGHVPVFMDGPRAAVGVDPVEFIAANVVTVGNEARKIVGEAAATTVDFATSWLPLADRDPVTFREALNIAGRVWSRLQDRAEPFSMFDGGVWWLNRENVIAADILARHRSQVANGLASRLLDQTERFVALGMDGDTLRTLHRRLTRLAKHDAAAPGIAMGRAIVAFDAAIRDALADAEVQLVE